MTRRRYTAVTNVARHAGYPVAQTFAGHTPPTITGTYIHATLEEVAATIAGITGEPHPLANPPSPRDGRGRQLCRRLRDH